MKGLLIKDFRLLFGQSKVYIIVFLIGIMTIVTGMEPSFFVGYITFIFAMLALSTLTYDEYENGMQYLLTLPVSAKTYVYEKYILGAGSSVVASLLSLLFYFVFFIKKGTDVSYELPDILFISITESVLVILMISLTIPFVIHFGAEKGRIALISVVIAITIIGVGIKKTLEKMGMKDAFIATIDSSGQFLFVLLVVFALAVLGISVVISVKIMEHKEF